MRGLGLIGSVLLSASLFAVEKPEVQPKADYVRPYAVAPGSPPIVLAWTTPRPYQRLRLDNDTYCYTMHTLIAERKPESDETEIVKQRTCTPASQFQVKHAEQQAK